MSLQGPLNLLGSFNPPRHRCSDEIKDKFDALYLTVSTSLDNIPLIIQNIYDFELLHSDCLKDVHSKSLLLFGDAISNMDESLIIRYYKNLYEEKKINLILNRKCSCDLITANGKITYERYALKPKTKDDYDKLYTLEKRTTVVPLDEYLGLANLPFKMTPFAMISVAESAVRQLSYKAAADDLLRSCGIEISYDYVRKVTNHIGEIVYRHDLEIANTIEQNYNNCTLSYNKEKTDSLLYIIIDGSMLRTREKDENGLKWRENKLAILFSSKDMTLKSGKNNERHYNIKNFEYVDYFGSVDIFKKLLFASSIKFGYLKNKKIVIISDGATWISNLREMLFPDALHILDFWHLTQHVYEFSKIYFHYDQLKFEFWADKIKSLLLDSKYLDVIAEVKIMEDEIIKNKYKGLSIEDKKKIGSLSRYLNTNINKIDYKEYCRKNLLIGSGHIESGNKKVAQERLKRPGMMWNVPSAQYLLTLRAKYCSSNLWASEVVKTVLNKYNLLTWRDEKQKEFEALQNSRMQYGLKIA